MSPTTTLLCSAESCPLHSPPALCVAAQGRVPPTNPPIPLFPSFVEPPKSLHHIESPSVLAESLFETWTRVMIPCSVDTPCRTAGLVCLRAMSPVAAATAAIRTKPGPLAGPCNCPRPAQVHSIANEISHVARFLGSNSAVTVWIWGHRCERAKHGEGEGWPSTSTINLSGAGASVSG